MTIKAVHHLQITYSLEVEDATIFFYSQVLGLTKIPRPDALKNEPGAWYKLGDVELHVSVEKNPQNQSSRRHICFQVNNLSDYAEKLQAHGIEILPDQRLLPECDRFFLRDPAGNRLEITEFKHN